MAHIQEHYSLSELCASRQQPQSQPQSLFFYDINSSAAGSPQISMAQPLLQSPFRPDMDLSQSQWPAPQAMLLGSMVSQPDQMWAQQATTGHDTIWTGVYNSAHMEGSLFPNNNLLYSHDASQNSFSKALNFRNPSFWPSNDVCNAAPSPSADILLSPATPFSDTKHTYSPCSDNSPMTPSRSITSYGESNGGMKVSTPGFAPPTPQSVIQQYAGAAAMQHGYGSLMAPADNLDGTTMYGSERSHEQSQKSSPAMTPWYPPGYGEEAAVAQHSRQANIPLFDGSLNSYLTPLERDPQEQWSNKTALPAQSHLQARFVAPMTESERAQRTKDDEVLLEMKRDGYTYKDIRKRLSCKVAESTLRGRYRSLTKPRSARVRAPKWTEVDRALMKRYVQDEFDKLDDTQPSLEAKQKPEKIPWAKIAEKMAATGGSYKFGAATVKKFQLRFCPSLAKKPIPKLETPSTTPKKHFDPFDNPPPALHIADIPTSSPTHLLVLNKFPIIPDHFILATKTNKQQTHILEQDDLEATYACLKAWSEDPTAHSTQKRLFAFFNSGEHSGASQPHRHIQFLPVEKMRDHGEADGWDLLIDLILAGEEDTGASSHFLQNANIPFAHFGRRYDAEPTGEQLLRIYNELYGLAKDAVDGFIAKDPGAFALHPTEGGDSPISYNLAMTTEGMVVLPRRCEGTMLKRSDGSEMGFVALNGTTLGGTMLVKNQEEWDVLRLQRDKLDSILNAVGIPRVSRMSKSAFNL